MSQEQANFVNALAIASAASNTIVDGMNLFEYMWSRLKPAVVEYFQEKMFKNRPDLLEKNASNIDVVVDALLHSYDADITLYQMFLEKNTQFTAESVRFDIADILFELQNEIVWIEE